MDNKRLKVLMVAAEAAPFAKVGGLGDVVGSLPPALHKLGLDVRVMMPLYGSIIPLAYGLRKIIDWIDICAGGKKRSIAVWTGYLPRAKVPVYFIDAPFYFRSREVYIKNENAERFLFFSLAGLHALPYLRFQPNIIHCHDFHTALVPDLLKALNIGYFKQAKTVYTIHNLNYQGQSDIEVLSTGNLCEDSLATLARDARDGDINFMVQGILNADAVTTVSPTYAREIATSIYGAKLDKIIRQRKKDLSGILNGIDTDLFDPAQDKFIARKYGTDSLSRKTHNKLVLQKKLGLPINEAVPMAGVVSRLVWQKGLDLISEKFAKLPCQFVFLGTGQARCEKHLFGLARRFPRQFNAQITFDPELAQMIYAGADIFLMPSRFEPCGLGQMIAMRYGTVPVVRRTGGLFDTVNHRVGFSFKPLSGRVLFQTLKKAIEVYRTEPLRWRRLQLNGMRQDFSWDASAKEYVKLYRKLFKKKS